MFKLSVPYGTLLVSDCFDDGPLLPQHRIDDVRQSYRDHLISSMDSHTKPTRYLYPISKDPRINIDMTPAWHFCVWSMSNRWRPECLCYLGISHRHWNGNVLLMKFSSLAAPEVVNMTTSSAARDEHIVKMITSPLQSRSGTRSVRHACCPRHSCRR